MDYLPMVGTILLGWSAVSVLTGVAVGRVLGNLNRREIHPPSCEVHRLDLGEQEPAA